MRARGLAVLALAALVPSAALADQHPLECLGGYTWTKGEAVPADRTSAGTADDGATIARARMNCTWLAGNEIKPAAADLGLFGFFPAATISVGGSDVPEALFGVIGYFRKWNYMQPLVRVLPIGVTTTPDGKALPSMVGGLSLDFRSPCPGRDGFLKDACEFVRPGARIDGDVLYRWKDSRDFSWRWGLNLGFRLEMCEHRHP